MNLLLQKAPQNIASLFEINNKSFITDIPVEQFPVEKKDFDSIVLTHLIANESSSILPKSIIIGCAREKIEARNNTREPVVSKKDERAIKLHRFISINDTEYELSGIARHISHNSTISEGHYIAYCKSFNKQEFYEFNDAIVNQITFEEVIKRNSKECKLLVYTQTEDTISSLNVQSQEGNNYFLIIITFYINFWNLFF